MNTIIKGTKAWDIYETFDDEECISMKLELPDWEEVYKRDGKTYTFTCPISDLSLCEVNMVVEIEEDEND